MTVLEQTTAQVRAPSQQRLPLGTQRKRPINIGENERAVSLASGAILALLGLTRGSKAGLLVAAAGGALCYRGATGHSHIYSRLGIDTAKEKGIHVEQAFLINRSPEELYAFWRDFQNLPSIMTHLESVHVSDERHSHWVAKAPRLAGGAVEWDAEITEDEPGSRIAWRSLGDSQVENAGEIRFLRSPGDRGTEVHVWMDYLPPAGKVGHWIATVLGQSPRRQMREDLRNFKRMMETGEIPTTAGQPRGTCTGQGMAS